MVNKVLLPRAERISITSCAYLFLMEALNNFTTINLPAIMIEHMNKVADFKDGDHGLTYGFLLTKVFEHFKVPLGPAKVGTKKQTFSKATLEECEYCTVTETVNTDQQPKVTESPELPDWVKIVKKEETVVDFGDDDFLLPSFSEWVKNEKLHAREVDVRGLASDIADSDVDKINKLLRFHFKAPDAVVDALNNCTFDVSECLVEQILKRFSCEWIPSYGFFKWAKVQKGVTLSSDLYNLMVDNLGKSKKFDLMRELMDEMSHLQGYVSLNTMIKIMRRLAKAGKYEDAIEAFKRMKEFGVQKNTSGMNALIDALVKEEGCHVLGLLSPIPTP
ncbi:pentatricopeptide repeat-containing protein At3g22670, mitochondrial-like [Nicotiana sylvestris]|uniref:Pentatricopeptide repeat-containing protein At3g22670, mitochondrial-like n=2 Tax=Nicotiana TaxID=4085 RepID=A0A1S4CQS8_TOBAC|nr:PREDICTED: pentatricopeptide repeat-containing protein At3g22670, mitochondrial-like [Nicotiana sylvestris]XP_016503440.1 PREDICTED: pentatricopeptide repeat-containing protein At3g22670, mitochondrial-like [Nicotiana tabacum]